jgi:beta-glucanase (GH16 family)
MKKIAFIIFSFFASISTHAQWDLIWQDEFDGSSLDTTKWKVDVGGNGWGNNESQYYTAQGNLNIQNSLLTITAKAEQFGNNQYTSAKIKTEGKFNVRFGKIETRMKCPMGQGLWPAFWMLGSNHSTIGWPKCGEIDVIEHINSETKVHGTAHWDNVGHIYWGGIINNDPTQFHNYSIIWDSTKIQWFMDDQIYYQLNTLNGVNGTEEFQNSFYLILNLAVGGDWPGYPNANTIFPAEMLVDYVKVYQPSNANSIADNNKNSDLFTIIQNDRIILKSNFDYFKIISINGQILNNEKTQSKEISIKDLMEGFYFIELYSNEKVYRKSFIKS